MPAPSSELGSTDAAGATSVGLDRRAACKVAGCDVGTASGPAGSTMGAAGGSSGSRAAGATGSIEVGSGVVALELGAPLPVTSACCKGRPGDGTGASLITTWEKRCTAAANRPVAPAHAVVATNAAAMGSHTAILSTRLRLRWAATTKSL